MDSGAIEAEQREVALTQRAATGDAVALKLLLTETYPRVCTHLSARIPADLRRIVDPEDIVQEAEIDVFRRIEVFEPRGPNSFYRWFATIAVSRLRDAIRWDRAAKRGGGALASNQTRRSIEDSTIALLDLLAAPGNTPSQSVARGEAIRAVGAALGEIPEDHRQAVQLVHLEGRPVAEAAAQMGRTERAIHGLCRRGLRHLQERLQSASRFLGSD